MPGNYGWHIGKSDKDLIPTESEKSSVPSRGFQAVGYYWCQSSGEIPSGAIKAGIDKDGGDVYVGRAFHQGEFLPAKVLANQNIAYVPWNGEEHAKHEFEVLCKGGSVVVWQESSGGAVPPGAVAVGRTSDSERLFIGRVFHDGTLTPGKIHPSHGVCYIPYDGREISYPAYEVLILHE